MREKRYIYVVSTVDLKEKTEAMLKSEYEQTKAKYDTWKNKSYEEFYEFQKGWGWHRYKLRQEDNSYFMELDKAKEAVINNFADINDGGTYNYALIKKVPVGKAYGMLSVKELYIFKYDRESDKYIEVGLEDNEETKYIISNIAPILI